MTRKKSVDRAKLRVAIRRLDDKRIYNLLSEALDLLPDRRLLALARLYFDPDMFLSDIRATPSDVLSEIKAFEAASLRGEYYESFCVNSKNYRDTSKGTRAWIAEFHRLVDCCVQAAAKDASEASLQAIEILIGLLRHIDKCMDDVVFFADEGGSWQVGVDWKVLFPAWFRCLSVTCTPETYATRVLALVNEFETYNRDKHLAMAKRLATSDQRRHLVQLIRGLAAR